MANLFHSLFFPLFMKVCLYYTLTYHYKLCSFFLIWKFFGGVSENIHSMWKEISFIFLIIIDLLCLIK